MSITIKPTKIKQSVYLLVPKSIVDLIEIENKTQLSLTLKKSGQKHILEYSLEWLKNLQKLFDCS